jgi:aminocarboxymuconate-semialdehyde decarboxylase
MPIDVHAHYVPETLLAAIRRDGAGIGVRLEDRDGSPPALSFDYGFKARPFFPKLVEPAEARRKSLEKQGLDRQFVATWPDIFGYGLEAQACRAWHRMLNDTLAQWCAERSDRFSLVASVPLPDGDDAATELRRAVGLGAVAVMVPANVEGTNLGEVPLDAFWAAAESTSTPVMVHPVLAGPAPRAAKFGLTQIVQYTFDTTLAVGSLLSSGVLDRFPRLVLAPAHGGGAFPYLLGRFDVMHARMDRAAQGDVALAAPSEYAPRLVYDTIVHAPKALRFLADAVGLDQLVLGTDESFPPADLDPIGTLNMARFSRAEIQRICEHNPRRIFSRCP